VRTERLLHRRPADGLRSLAGCTDAFHDLRRSGVRHMVRAGVPQNVAMKISGHKTASMFRRYDIANEEDLRAAMESVAKYHEAAGKKVISMGQQ
jgi:integrase